jgi:hypothetical protein
MQLQGRNLTPGLSGADVHLLHQELSQIGFSISLSETSRSFFGRSTSQAVQSFQKGHGLETSGIVDPLTAQAINNAVRQESQGFSIVQGKVAFSDGKPASDLLMRALHRDLRDESLLGESVTGADGAYQISYPANPTQFPRLSAVQLVVRVYNPLGLLLASSKTLRNPPSPATMNFELASSSPVQLSDFERLLQAIAPLVEDLPLASLTEEQIEFIASGAGVKPEEVGQLSRAAQLAESTRLLSPAVFFGLIRLNQPEDLDLLLATNPQVIDQALQTVVARRIVPAGLEENQAAIRQAMEQLRLERGHTAARPVRGRLSTAENELPLAGFAIEVLEPAAGSSTPVAVDSVVTGSQGEFTFVFLTPTGPSFGNSAGRLFIFEIKTPEGNSCGRVEARVGPDDEVLELSIADPAVPSPNLPALADNLGLALPQGLLEGLKQRGIDTLDDLRRAGGFEHLDSLPPMNTGARQLAALAGLSAVPGEAADQKGVVDAGFTSPVAIARASRLAFANQAQEALGDFGAVKVQTQARAIDLLVKNVLTDVRVLSGDFSPPGPQPDPGGEPTDELAGLFLSACDCADCASALSPIAYLADLLDYARENLLSILPGEQTGPAVSLDDLAARFHQRFSELPAACEQVEHPVFRSQLGVEALRSLLLSRGLPTPGSPSEAVLAENQARYLQSAYRTLLVELGTTPEELRLALAAGGQAAEQLARRLGLDPQQPGQLSALSIASEALSEAVLEDRFGLADTTRDPFSPAEQPQLLSFRQERLRGIWQEQDANAVQPILDPDLIGPEYLKEPVAGAPAFDLRQARSDEIGEILAELRLARQTAADDLAWLEAAFQSVLGISSTELKALDARRKTGEDIREDLSNLGLSGPAFARLLRLGELVGLGALFEQEAQDAIDILVQSRKLGQFPTWRQEEIQQGLTLSADHFIFPPSSPEFPPPPPQPLNPWRADEAVLQRWRRTLRERTEAEEAVIKSLVAAVETAEAEHLPALREALAQATGENIEHLTDQLILDFQADGCQKTSRVDQAIETLQGILWSVRTHQLNDTQPDLELVDDQFDRAWKWLGSYETWRAALFAFLYPENILLPSLRSHQSPAFAHLVEETRTRRQFSPAGAREKAAAYRDYFRDVASLGLGATCFGIARFEPGDPYAQTPGSARRLVFLFARATATQTVYWSAYDPNNGSGYAQTFWNRVPGMYKVKSILGAKIHRQDEEHQYLYLFATLEHEGGQQLVYTRLNMNGGQQAWDEQPTYLPVKDDATNFKAVLKLAKDQNELPELAIELPRENGRRDIYRGLLQLTGETLAATAWLTLQTNAFYELLSMTAWGEDSFVVFLKRGNQLLAQSQGPLRVVSNQIQSWHGAFCWPGDENLVYAFWRDNAGLHATALWGEEAPVRQPLTFTPAFLNGLDFVAPHTSLRFFETEEQTLAYQLTGPQAGMYISRVTRVQAPGIRITMRSDPEADTSPGLTVIAMRRDTGLFPTTGQLGTITDPLPPEPPLPPPPPPDDPPPPVLIRLEERARLRAAPRLVEILNIIAPLDENQLQLRKATIASAFHDNRLGPASNLAYLEEAYFFVPMHLALQLQHSQHFVAALDWYQTVFDYGLPAGQRKIYAGLKLEESITNTYARAEDWLLDPLNPHAIASTRKNAYTRFTVMALAGCLIEYGDTEFTRDTSESVARARLLYDTALELLAPGEPAESCEQIVLDLEEEIGTEVGGVQPDWKPVWDHIREMLAGIGDIQSMNQTAEEIRNLWGGSEPVIERLGRIYQLVAETPEKQPEPPLLGEVLAEKNEVLARAHLRLQRVPAYAAAQAHLVQVVGGDLGTAVAGVAGVAVSELERDKTLALPWLRSKLPALETSDLTTVSNGQAALFDELAEAAPLRVVQSEQEYQTAYLVAPVYNFCIPANPRVGALRQHANLNQYKIRTCRNITGELRELALLGEADGRTDGLPAISGGRLFLPTAPDLRPTQYRFAALIERAKQLVNFAQQVEMAFLSTLEKRDAEQLGQLRARQDIQITRAGIRLQDLRVQEAESGTRLSELQRGRAQSQVNYYQDLLGENEFGFGTLLSLGAAAGIAAASASSFGIGLAVAAGSLFSGWSSNSNRTKEWERQLGLAQQDLATGNQQVILSKDRLRVVGQERNIAVLQAGHAEATADFLANKFTNAELYDWMSRVLEEVYAFFLQQATAMGKLAASQLAFERQETPPAFIQGGYLDAPLDAQAGFGEDAAAPDRRGLTGSTRLLQDIFQLDQFAFDTDRRRLQLTKTIPLAQFAPAEFQRFRQTGVMRFNTSLEMFDRDFPGHYLRLIRRVRCTVIALIPPTGGIRASLGSSGISRVVVPDGNGFQTIGVTRPPESISLTSPRDATGLFELSPQPQEFLLPFEGLGVETAWELEMPKAANPFDFDTLADVLITIEYTSLSNFEYRQQVIQELDATLSNDRPFSFRHELSDAFYDLNNPEQFEAADQMRVRWITRLEDFPPNLEELQIQHMALYFDLRESETGTGLPAFEIPITELTFTEQGSGQAVGGPTTTLGGIASTQQGSAPAWESMLGKAPFGEWELALQDPLTDGRSVVDALKSEEILDILLLITYQARTPDWPE